MEWTNVMIMIMIYLNKMIGLVFFFLLRLCAWGARGGWWWQKIFGVRYLIVGISIEITTNQHQHAMWAMQQVATTPLLSSPHATPNTIQIL